MKWILVIATLVTLSGCVTAQRSSELATRPGVVFSGSPEVGFTITGVEIERAGTRAGHDGMGVCLATHIHNSSVQLSDSSRSFVGSYTGNYYNINSSRSEAAEQPVRFISANGSDAVVRGQTSYTYTYGLAAITRVVRFTLNIKQSAKENRYSFSNIEAAQTSTGILPNNGFTQFYDMAVLYPERAYDGLSNLTEVINGCLAAGSK